MEIGWGKTMVVEADGRAFTATQTDKKQWALCLDPLTGHTMRTNRRNLISCALAGGLAATWPRSCHGSRTREPDSGTKRSDYARLDEILKEPVLKKKLFATPVIIKTLELLRYKGSFLCRVRSSDGAEGMSVGHNGMNSLYPIFTSALKPFFIGKDARDLNLLLRSLPKV